LQTNFKNPKQKQKLGAGASRLIRAVGTPSAAIVAPATQLQKLKTQLEARRGCFATHPRRWYAYGDDPSHYQPTSKTQNKSKNAVHRPARCLRGIWRRNRRCGFLRVVLGPRAVELFLTSTSTSTFAFASTFAFTFSLSLTLNFWG
jgi:hypothetical protein